MSTPSLALCRISVIMRGLRQDKGISLREAANMLGTNKNRLDRVERAQLQRVDPGIITGWAFKYGAPEKVMLELDALAMQTRDADANGWEDVFATMPKWFSAFLTLEKEAATIDSYEVAYIPGLLQVRAYTEALLSVHPFITTDEMAEAIRLRLLRQEWVFNRPPGKLARMRFILDEACFLRIKEAPYFEEQTQRLLELSQLDPVEIYVAPMSRGLYSSLKGPYVLMSFGGPYAPELVYLETEYGARYLDDRRAVGRFREVFSDTLNHVTRVEEYLSDVEP